MTAKPKPTTVRLPPDLTERIDKTRGLIPREAWVRRELEAALSGQRPGHTPAVTSPQRSGSTKETAPTESSAPPRASDRANRTIPDAGTPLPKIAERRRQW